MNNNLPNPGFLQFISVNRHQGIYQESKSYYILMMMMRVQRNWTIKN